MEQWFEISESFKGRESLPSLHSAGEEIVGRGAAASPCWVPHAFPPLCALQALGSSMQHRSSLCSAPLTASYPCSETLWGTRRDVPPRIERSTRAPGKACELVQHHPFCWLRSSLTVSSPKCWWSLHANVSFPPVACVPMSAAFPLLPAVEIAKLLLVPEEFRLALPCVEAILV